MEASQLPGGRRGNDVSQPWGWVCCCCRLLSFFGGRGASQLPGGRRGKGGESALELCVMLSSSSFAGNGGESALELCVSSPSSAGHGGESASGGRRGNDVSQPWGWVCCCCRLLSVFGGAGGESASGGAKGEGGRVSFGVGRGASQLPGLRRGKRGESALELCVMLSSSSFAGNGGESALELCVSSPSSAGHGGESASGGAKGE